MRQNKTPIQDLTRQVQDLIKQVQDLARQLAKYLPISLLVIERHNRGYEELDSLRLSLEELRELLSDYFSESSHNADKINDRLERLERLALLEKAQANPRETQEIKLDIVSDLRKDSLRREYLQQTKNLAHAHEKAARYGINVPIEIMNEIDLYQERIEALKKEL